MTYDFHLRRLAPPVVARDGDDLAPVTARPSAALVGALRRENALVEEILGTDDLSTTTDEYLAANTNQKYNRKVRLVAVAGPAPRAPMIPVDGAADATAPTAPTAATAAASAADRFAPYPAVAALAHLPTVSTVVPATSAGAEEAPAVDLPDVGSPDDVLGLLALTLPDRDNRHLGYVDVFVAPQERGRGVGGALHDQALAVLRAEGRRTAAAWTMHRAGGPAGPAGAAGAAGPAGPDTAGRPGARTALVPPTGVGSVAQDSSTDWLLGLGWTLQQCERHSVLDLDRSAEGRAQLETWRDEAVAVAGPDYRVHTWRGVVPEDRRGQMAELLRNMSIDVPQADLDLEEEVWDAQRVVDAGVSSERAGLRTLATAVEHVPSGDLVGYTQVELPRAKPAVVYQENTIVLGAHRGHRLGLLVKAVNHLALLDGFPDARRVHTWNAGENAHMLAINELMGFRERSVEGAWERRVDPSA